MKQSDMTPEWAKGQLDAAIKRAHETYTARLRLISDRQAKPERQKEAILHKARDRRVQAVKLRSQGLKFVEIGKQLGGIGGQRAAYLVRRGKREEIMRNNPGITWDDARKMVAEWVDETA